MDLAVMEISLCNNFINNITEFIDELIKLLKEDWKKFKHFYNENSNYIFYLFIALVTMQFTDIMRLGSSWNRYSKKNNIQTGGANQSLTSETIEQKTLNPVEAYKQKKYGEIKNKRKSKELASQTASDAGIKKKLNLFQRLKGRVNRSAGAQGLAGPVFNNIDGIINALGGVFTIIGLILVVVGVLSLPILIFLIITYYILKTILGKLLIL